MINKTNQPTQSTKFMKAYLQIIVKILFLTTLFCMQLCFIHYHQTPPLHIILLAYAYILFTSASMWQLSLLLFFLDTLTFIHTNVAGITIIALIPLSIFLDKIKKDFYINIIAPCLLIIAYQIFQIVLFTIVFHQNINLISFIINSFTNCTMFTFLWYCTKQPFHH